MCIRDRDSSEPPIEVPTSSGDLPSFVWPVEGKYVISTTYGYVRSGETPHRGIDIPAPNGTNIYAVESGTVITAGYHLSLIHIYSAMRISESAD